MKISVADLLPFCSKLEVSRFAITSPWKFDEFITATDGHAAIVVPAESVVDFCSNHPEDARFPNINSIIPDLTSRERIDLKLSVLTHLEHEKHLAEIEEYEETYVDCDACNGTGICERMCGDEHNCKDCDGEGGFSKGTPPAKHLHDLQFNINDKAFQYRLVKHVREFAAKHGFDSVEYFDAKTKSEVGVFKAGEAAFYVMPMCV